MSEELRDEHYTSLLTRAHELKMGMHNLEALTIYNEILNLEFLKVPIGFRLKHSLFV